MLNVENYLIIGGSSGIGLSVAKKLANEGKRCILVSSSKEKLELAKSQLVGDIHEIFQYDLENIYHIEKIFDFLQSKNIKLNGMVFCAGISPLILLKDSRPEDSERVFRINYFSFIELIKYYYKEENSFEGSGIVAITSITAYTSGYRQILYGSSKAALITTVKKSCRELLNRNIRINCVSPGCTDTEMLDSLREKSVDLDKKIKISQPLGILKPDNVADMVMMLLSPVGNFITGQEIVYDGGALL